MVTNISIKNNIQQQDLCVQVYYNNIISVSIIIFEIDVSNPADFDVIEIMTIGVNCP